MVTYCTGGIRCEVLSSLMVNRGFKEVYQLDGGIVRYGEAFGDQGLWEGSLYVFDKRMHLEFSEDAKTIGECVRCRRRPASSRTAPMPSCRTLTLYCADVRRRSGDPALPGRLPGLAAGKPPRSRRQPGGGILRFGSSSTSVLNTLMPRAW